MGNTYFYWFFVPSATYAGSGGEGRCDKKVLRWGGGERNSAKLTAFTRDSKSPSSARGGGREKEQVVKRDSSFLFLDTDLHVSGGGKSATIVGRKKKDFQRRFFWSQNPFKVSKEDARN